MENNGLRIGVIEDSSYLASSSMEKYVEAIRNGNLRLGIDIANDFIFFKEHQVIPQGLDILIVDSHLASTDNIMARIICESKKPLTLGMTSSGIKRAAFIDGTLNWRYGYKDEILRDLNSREVTQSLLEKNGQKLIDYFCKPRSRFEGFSRDSSIKLRETEFRRFSPEYFQ